MSFGTSPVSGKRPVSLFEKTSFPSTTTSKIPPEPFVSFASIPNAFFSSAARLAALGS